MYIVKENDLFRLVPPSFPFCLSEFDYLNCKSRSSIFFTAISIALVNSTALGHVKFALPEIIFEISHY